MHRAALFSPKAPLLVEKRPVLSFNYDLSLVRAGYWQWRATDFAQRPDPYEIAHSDEAWIEDLSKYAEWVRFHQDGGKNPSTDDTPDDDDTDSSE